MLVNALVDVEVVALEQEDEVTVMLDLAAPGTPTDAARPPAAVQVVLDRSGSMFGERLDAAKQALMLLIDRLDPSDSFGLVAFDDTVKVVVPAGPLTNKVAVSQAISALQAGGLTNLSAGLLRGLQEARRVAGDSGATLLLLSDGHANEGEIDPGRLAAVAAAARKHGTTTSTIGIGTGYDELLLAEVGRGGQGNHVFAEQGEDAAAAVAGEVTGLLSKTVQAVSLIVRPQAPVDSVKVFNDVPGQRIDGGIMFELGDLWAGEQRKLLISFSVPAMAGLGLAQVAELELRYVTVPEFTEETVTVPVHVNVVPGDQAAGRIPDVRVASERAFLEVQETKRKAAQALRDGDRDQALLAFDEADGKLASAMSAAPSAELDMEQQVINELRDRTEVFDDEYVAKLARSEHSRKSRKRGRGN